MRIDSQPSGMASGSTPPPAAPVDCLIRLAPPKGGDSGAPTVLGLTGLSRSTVYKLIRTRRFPPPRHIIGATASRWSLNDVQAWIAAQCAAPHSTEAAHA